MKFIQDLHEGNYVREVYLVKEKRTGETRSGRPFETVLLQDKTGTIDGMIWNPNSPGIGDYDVNDFICIAAEVKLFNGALQMNISNIRTADETEYLPSDYMPSTGNDVNDMYGQLLAYVDSVENPYLHELLDRLFRQDQAFVKSFREHSAAKTVHHSYSGGLLEHTLAVTRMCDFLAGQYSMLNRDLLLTAAMCHDIGKTEELSDFPLNDYTDAGQLLGHIVIGTEMITAHVREIPGFPVKLENLLKHCILSHHGEFEYGSPKLPSIIEAAALNLADKCDAKLQTLTETLTEKAPKADKDGWIGYNRFFETNLRRTDI